VSAETTAPGACDPILLVECLYLFSESLRRMQHNRELRKEYRNPTVSMHEDSRTLRLWQQLNARPTVAHDGCRSARVSVCRRRTCAGATDRLEHRRMRLLLPSGGVLSAVVCSYLSAAAAG